MVFTCVADGDLGDQILLLVVMAIGGDHLSSAPRVVKCTFSHLYRPYECACVSHDLPESVNACVHHVAGIMSTH